jgi:hypothetical protein
MSATEEMQMKRTTLLMSIGLVALLAPAAGAERKVEAGDARRAPETLSLDVIVQRHVAALGGEKLLREGKTFTFTVSGEKMGKKFTKVVTHARPNMMRVDIKSGDGPVSKGYDGKVAWMKKGTAAAEKMNAEDTVATAQHADFDEPLLDYAKKGSKLKLIGKTAEGYDLELTTKSGEVEHHILDAGTFLLAKKTWTGKDKDGKSMAMAVKFGDWKNVQGRAVNHSVEWQFEGKWHKSTVSDIAFDKPVDAKIFAMPK